MAFEIRNLKSSEEMTAASLISAQAFGAPHRFDIEPFAKRMQSLYPPEDHIGAFEDGELTAFMHVIPRTMRINGGSVGFGAVSPVASSALHRRKGHAAALLRQSLVQMRDRGQPLSGLYTPHPALYRRYGWEIAGGQRRYEFNPKDLQLTHQPSQRGRLRHVTVDDWQRLDAVYERHAAAANGPFERDEMWWRNWVFGTWMGTTEGILWQDADGIDQGYVLYFDPVTPEPSHTSIIVSELIARTGDAYLNLLLVLAQHDIRAKISIPAPLDDPLQLLFLDAERLQIAERFRVMLRVVDLEAALRARPLSDVSLNTEVTLRVTDTAAPWNDGTWRLCAADGRLVAERAPGDGELRLDAKVLAPLYSGYVTPSRAAAAGLLRAESDDALRRAEAILAVTQLPYYPDQY